MCDFILIFGFAIVPQTFKILSWLYSGHPRLGSVGINCMLREVHTHLGVLVGSVFMQRHGVTMT